MAIVARVNRVRVSVNDTAIARAFVPGGMVWDNMRRFMLTTLSMGRIEAPVRSGELMRSLGQVLTPSGRNQCRGTLYADADHARYVVGGTRPLITGNMKVRLAPHSYYTRPTSSRGYPGVLRREVRGQRANDFLTRAVRRALRIHGVG